MRRLLHSFIQSTFSSLTIADYRRVFFGNAAFQCSNFMQMLVFPWLLLEIGRSPIWLGLGGLSYAVVMIGFGPIGGMLADVYERRRVMLVTQAIAVVVNACVALLYWLKLLETWHLLLASLCMGASFTLNLPSRQSIMAELVPRRLMQNAVAMHSMSQNVSRIIGPALAGSLMAAIGALPVLLINMGGNCWTISQLCQVRYRPPARAAKVRFGMDHLREGFAYAWRRPEVRQVLGIIAVSNFFGLSYLFLMPALARDVLHVGPEGLGALMSAMAGGALVGSLILARLRAVSRKPLWLGISSTAIGALLALLGRLDSAPAAAATLALVGAGTSTVVAFSLGAIAEVVPERLSGRVFGIYMQLNGFTPLGSLPSSALAATVGTADAITIWGGLCALLSAALLAVQILGLRRQPKTVARSGSAG